MRVQFAVQIENRPAQTLTNGLASVGSRCRSLDTAVGAANRSDRPGGWLQLVALAAVHPPCNYGYKIKTNAVGAHTLASLFDATVLDRRRYRCLTCGAESYPIGAETFSSGQLIFSKF